MKIMIGAMLAVVILAMFGIAFLYKQQFAYEQRFLSEKSFIKNICKNSTFDELAETAELKETAELAEPAEKRTGLVQQHRHQVAYIITPKNVYRCWEEQCGKDNIVDWKMIFLIKSTANHISIREQLRRTWASISYLNKSQFLYVFVLGKTDLETEKQVKEEHELYGDILQLDIPERYGFVHRKTLGGMQWVAENFPDTVFYTSCDDDLTINLGGVIERVNEFRKIYVEKKFPEFPILCIYKTRISDGPDRNRRSKYYISTDEYKWPNYPDYCLGGAYTTSVGVVRQLWEISNSTGLLKMDDVWITGILRKKLGMPSQYIKPINPTLAFHHTGFGNRDTKSRNDFMENEWKKIYDTFKIRKVCKCKST